MKFLPVVMQGWCLNVVLAPLPFILFLPKELIILPASIVSTYHIAIMTDQEEGPTSYKERLRSAFVKALFFHLDTTPEDLLFKACSTVLCPKSLNFSPQPPFYKLHSPPSNVPTAPQPSVSTTHLSREIRPCPHRLISPLSQFHNIINEFFISRDTIHAAIGSDNVDVLHALI